MDFQEELLKDVPILIFANKQDLPCALSVEDIGERLQLDRISQPHSECAKDIIIIQYFIHECKTLYMTTFIHQFVKNEV